jgi:teichuronic acid biosynthesis glycosyltransferase TuaC
MNVLFVSGGNSPYYRTSPFIISQGESLIKNGVDLEYFRIIGKGFFGYLKNVKFLRLHLRVHKYDIIHAHYSLSALVCLLTFTKTPIVVSFMGSDVYGSYNNKNRPDWRFIYLPIISYLIQYFPKHIIVKSENIAKKVFFRKKLSIIPNGVKTEKCLITKDQFLSLNRLSSNKKYLIFLADVSDPRKNFRLAQEAFKLINNPDIELLTPFPVSHSEVFQYLNFCDVLLLTSLLEGSPNIIKEAMMCNCPIVATDVGDVRWILENTPGCFVSSFNPSDIAEKIKLALKFREETGFTKGIDRIKKLGLDLDTVAGRIIEIYKNIIQP